MCSAVLHHLPFSGRHLPLCYKLLLKTRLHGSRWDGILWDIIIYSVPNFKMKQKVNSQLKASSPFLLFVAPFGLSCSKLDCRTRRYSADKGSHFVLLVSLQVGKPRSYTSPKLCPLTRRPTGVQCRAILAQLKIPTRCGKTYLAEVWFKKKNGLSVRSSQKL